MSLPNVVELTEGMQVDASAFHQARQAGTILRISANASPAFRAKATRLYQAFVLSTK
jgi:hypothetical protein